MTLDDMTRSWLLAGLSTVVAAYFVQRFLSAGGRQSEKEVHHKSRLLEHRFGNVHDLNDLALQEEEEEEEQSSSSSSSDTKRDRQDELNVTKKATQQVDENQESLKTEDTTKKEVKVEPTTVVKPQKKTPKPSRKSKQSFSAALQRQQQQQPPPPLPPTTQHPGLGPFLQWWEVQTSLYRIYTVHRWDGLHDPPPYNPSSRRGNTKVDLRVTNHCQTRDLKVYWINYKGGYEEKGSIPKGGLWTQTTFIDHPWVFVDAETGQELASYIPYKIIPSVSPEAVTTAGGGTSTTGVHQFSLEDTPDGDPYCCRVHDPILPYQPSARNEDRSLQLALVHCIRTGYAGGSVLLQYLENLERGRRVIRIANKTFHDGVWNTAARGVLLALGFQEQGAYAQMAVRWSDACQKSVLKQVKQYCERCDTDTTPQPDGADGFGRAGYRL